MNTPKQSVSRVNRSISFPLICHAYITKRAAVENRSFNWIVNDIIQRHAAKSKPLKKAA